jgi:hypothetical protein
MQENPLDVQYKAVADYRTARYDKFRNSIKKGLAAWFWRIIWPGSTRAVFVLPSLHEMTRREQPQQEHKA